MASLIKKENEYNNIDPFLPEQSNKVDMLKDQNYRFKNVLKLFL